MARQAEVHYERDLESCHQDYGPEGRVGGHLVAPRHQRPTGQLHDRSDSMGRVRWGGGGENRTVVCGEETEGEAVKPHRSLPDI